MLPSPPPTGHQAVLQVVAGHFQETAGYSVWRPQGTDDWLLVLTIDGLGRFELDGQQVIAELGDLILLRPHTPHAYGVEASLLRWELIWTHFRARPEWVEWLDWPEAVPGILRLRLENPADRQRILRQFHLVLEHTRQAMRRRETLAMNALELLLLWCDDLNPRSVYARVDPRIRGVADFICRSFNRPLCMKDLAEQTGLSVSRMSHLFRDEMGLTPQQFIEQQRMRRAAELLSFTSRSVRDIAEDVGFDDPFYFSMRFRKFVGVSPRAYRNRIRPPAVKPT